MTIHTYFLSDRYGSREEFQAPNDDVAVEVAERLLADWYRYEDRSRTLWLHASLHRLTGAGEDADEDADDDGWVDMGGITVTLEAIEPDCTDESGHWYEHGDVFGSGGGVAWTDTCTRCGLKYHRDTWAQDAETGQQGLTEERYEVAERWSIEDVEEDEIDDDDGYEDQLRRVALHEEWLATEGADYLFGEGTL